MKSKLFKRTPTLPKEFSEDFDILASLNITEEILELIPKSLTNYTLAPESRTESEALDALRKKWVLKPEQMNAVLRVGGFFLKSMDIEDSLEDIMVDLETLVVIDKKKLSKIRPFLEALFKEFKDTFAIDSLVEGTQQVAIKNITGISHVVDIRSVITNRLHLGDSIENYDPQISKFVPVAILRLRLSGDDEAIFQMDGYTLKVLQDELKAIEKELEKTITLIGNDKIHRGRS